MPKIRILSPAERKAFQSPPLIQLSEKENYFAISDAIKKTLDVLHSPYRKVGFVLLLSYFRRVGRFFNPMQFHQQDITYVSKLLEIDHRNITLEKFKDHRLRQDQKKILGITGFQSFDSHEKASELLTQEITRLIDKQIRPKMIIYYLSHLFFRKKIETPSYQLMAETILQTTERFETKLLSTLENNLTKQHMQTLDQLLPKIDPKKSVKSESYYARAPLVGLREFPLSSRPGKIKESINGFLTIKKIFESTRAALQSLSLSPNALKYYAVWVQKAKITQLVQINNPYKRYLYLLAFIAHQYHYRQDLLVDTLLQLVQSTLNRIEKKQEEEDKNTKQEKERATHLLSMSYRDKTELLKKIHLIINTGHLSSEEKVTQIKELVSQEVSIRSRHPQAQINQLS